MPMTRKEDEAKGLQDQLAAILAAQTASDKRAQEALTATEEQARATQEVNN